MKKSCLKARYFCFLCHSNAVKVTDLEKRNADLEKRNTDGPHQQVPYQPQHAPQLAGMVWLHKNAIYLHIAKTEFIKLCLNNSYSNAHLHVNIVAQSLRVFGQLVEK